MYKAFRRTEGEKIEIEGVEGIQVIQFAIN